MKRRDVSPSSWLSAASKLPVPDLTSFADIQLNAQVLLQIHAKAMHDRHPNFRWQNRYCLAAGLSQTPNWYQHKCQKHRMTSLISFKTLKNSIKSSWRFECESAEPNTPTKSTQMSVLKQKPVVLPDGNNWLTSAQDDLGEARGTRRPQPANLSN